MTCPHGSIPSILRLHLSIIQRGVLGTYYKIQDGLNAYLTSMQHSSFRCHSSYAGAVLVVLMIFMAVTSSGASEMLAVSSLFTFDIYRRYIKPKVGPCIQALLMIIPSKFMNIHQPMLDRSPSSVSTLEFAMRPVNGINKLRFVGPGHSIYILCRARHYTPSYLH